MYPFAGYPFPSDEDDVQVEKELDENSPRLSLWQEVERLRVELKRTTARVEMLADGHTLDNKPILVIRYPENGDATQEDIESLAKVWQGKNANGSVMILPNEWKLESLDDDDLRQLGLTRRTTRTLSERESYDLMLTGRR